jgi:hypothetical protein
MFLVRNGLKKGNALAPFFSTLLQIMPLGVLTKLGWLKIKWYTLDFSLS